MNAATVTLWTAAVLIFAYAPVYLLVVGIRERRRDREDARRRTEQGRDVDGRWIASLADEPTPLFDQMCFERWEAEL